MVICADYTRNYARRPIETKGGVFIYQILKEAVTLHPAGLKCPALLCKGE